MKNQLLGCRNHLLTPAISIQIELLCLLGSYHLAISRNTIPEASYQNQTPITMESLQLAQMLADLSDLNAAVSARRS